MNFSWILTLLLDISSLLKEIEVRCKVNICLVHLFIL